MVLSSFTDAWINYIGVLPALALLDDDFLAHLMPTHLVAEARAAQADVDGSGATAAARRDYRRLATEERAALEGEDGMSSADEASVAPTSAEQLAARRRNPCCRRRAALRSYRATRTLIHLLLALFIACKSAAPLKELFAPAPWLNFYDDWFFVNAQGEAQSSRCS